MSADSKELAAIIILLVVVPYGWWSCIKILRQSRKENVYLTAATWKKIVFTTYYGFGLLAGPPFLGLLLYSLYTRYLRNFL